MGLSVRLWHHRVASVDARCETKFEHPHIHLRFPDARQLWEPAIIRSAPPLGRRNSRDQPLHVREYDHAHARVPNCESDYGRVYGHGHGHGHDHDDGCVRGRDRVHVHGYANVRGAHDHPLLPYQTD